MFLNSIVQITDVLLNLSTKYKIKIKKEQNNKTIDNHLILVGKYYVSSFVNESINRKSRKYAYQSPPKANTFIFTYKYEFLFL